MNMADTQQDSVSSLLSEFSTKLTEIEEKQRLLRDRALLIGDNLIKSKEEFDDENLLLNKRIGELESEIKGIKQTLSRIINELESFARKTELSIIQRQFQIFQPLELARIKDVEEIIIKRLNKLKNGNS